MTDNPWRISKRAQNVDVSGIRRAFDLAATLINPIDLSIGQPAFDAFDEMKQAVHEALAEQKSRYTQTQGILPLREKIASQYHVTLGPKCDLDVIVTDGVSGAFVLAYMALLDPGDEVLIPDPFFGMYRDLAKLLNANPVFYETYPNFRLPLENIASLVTPKTKAIVLNTPSNPTGVTLSEAEISSVIEIAKKHDLWLIYDEIYAAFTYDAPHPTPFGRYEKTLILNGFSKSHGVPGWRLGFALGPKPLIQEMSKVQQYSFVCAPSVLQWGAVRGLDIDLTPTITDYRKKRDLICDALKDKFSFVCPGGAFYVFPEAPGGSGQAFIERCLQENLIVVPGHCFSNRDTHFRISFSVPLATLERGAEILRKVVS